MLRRLMNFMLRPIANPAIESVYRICVAQARQPVFYADWHAPDTVDGRYDLLLLHVLLVMQRLHDRKQETQQLFDILFADMDRNLREMGVSDMRITKRIRPLVEAFYGRAHAYEQALAENDAALGITLRRNIYGNVEASPADIEHLTKYVRQMHTALAAQNIDDILGGKLSFPAVI